MSCRGDCPGVSLEDPSPRWAMLSPGKTKWMLRVVIFCSTGMWPLSALLPLPMTAELIWQYGRTSYSHTFILLCRHTLRKPSKQWSSQTHISTRFLAVHPYAERGHDLGALNWNSLLYTSKEQQEGNEILISPQTLFSLEKGELSFKVKICVQLKYIL